MRHRNRGRKLSRNSQERKALLRSLSRALILSKDGRIVTTPAKAKEATPFLHKLVTRARHSLILLEGAKQEATGSAPRKPVSKAHAMGLANFRFVLAQLADKPAAMKLLKEIAPQMAERGGGYTRILHLGGYRGKYRAWSVGDAADRAMWEFVGLTKPEEQGPPGKQEGEKKGLMGKLREKIQKKQAATQGT